MSVVPARTAAAIAALDLTALVQRAVATEPGGELAERIRAQRVESLGAVAADFDEAGGVEDRQVARHAGLVNTDGGDDLPDRQLSSS